MGPNCPGMGGLILFLMLNVCYLAKIFIFLVVTGSYCLLPGGYCFLPGGYCLLLLITAHSHFKYEHLKSLKKNSMLAIHWLENNYMKFNTDKCYLIVSGYKHEQVWANIGKDLIEESNDVKLFWTTIDRDF